MPEQEPNTRDMTTDETVNALKKLVPIVGATVVAMTAFFNLQAQVSDLRLKVEYQNQRFVEYFTDIRSNIQDIKTTQQLSRDERRQEAAEAKAAK